ncbi:hypothetical protein T459_14784 [Capsicum annuum]|uniref:Nucleotidyl transferase domain-containing protein n=1 Tax=Capsicum annuum TaxID=4072 RepID=A0A2G2ZID5_CAPAN|nr:hypothetical protein T459_14784 [Capsicum annuum]
MGTILVSKVSADTASEFGELAADPVTKELLHYTEKAETFVSDRINCGVYVFTPDIFNAIQGVSTQRKDRANLRRVSSFEALQPANRLFARFRLLDLLLAAIGHLVVGCPRLP